MLRPILYLSRRSNMTVASWKTKAPTSLPNTLTFAAQSSLPKLPVPPLADSLTRLKESLRPLAWTQEELLAAGRKIDEFGSPTGMGRILQQRLEGRAKETDHWLEEWWDDAGYLAYRDSVVVNVSYYYGFNDQPAHLPQTPASRAAALTRSAFIFRQGLKRGTLKPETLKDGPICMDSYRWMFDCCRVPAIPSDYSVTYSKAGSTGDEGHIVVFRRNRPWKVQCFDRGRLLSTSELEKQFQYIYDNTTQDFPGVGVLTASHRDIWTKDYEELSSDHNNVSIITDIHSAAFTVSLEHAAPETPVQFSRALWHGDVRPSDGTPTGLENRWCDKPVQFIIYDNTRAGIMGEHSVMDGTPTCRMCDDVIGMVADPAFNHGTPSSTPVAPPQPMNWTITPTLQSAIASASKDAAELVGSQTLNYHLTSYGKREIKAAGVSPDGWSQMMIQLAFGRVLASTGQRRAGGTYEAASTRRFYKGRTETIRVVSNESKAWVCSMDDSTCTRDERRALFMNAVKRHGADARRSGQGMGFDRHVFGLKKLLKPDEPLPAMYTDDLIKRSTYWVLSTSSVFSKHFTVYGWGEVVPDGFGVAYMTGFDDKLMYTVTSRKEMPNDLFIKEIAKAAEDIRALFDQKAKL